MTADVSGTVLEVFPGKGKEGAIITVARLYQKGEKRNIDVKGVSPDTKVGSVATFHCKLYPWANEKGLADIAFSVIV